MLLNSESGVKSEGKCVNRDVIIIGSGVTGLSCHYWLNKIGVSSVQTIAPEALRTQTDLCPASATVGFADNFTRLHHAWGPEVATLLWKYTHSCFEELKRFLASNKIATDFSDRIRLAYNKHEALELETAISLLDKCGFQVDRALSKKLLLEGGSAVLQIEKNGALCFDKNMFLQRIKQSIGEAVTDGRVKELEATNEKITVKTENGQTFSTQFLVIASAEACRTLLERGNEIFIPYADQYSKFEGAGSAEFAKGTVISSYHGLFVGGVNDDGCWLGGARYLRKNAGIGEIRPNIHPAAAEQIKKRAQSIFGIDNIKANGEAYAMLGCRPCDELPVIGPYVGNSRILVASGYMGWGLALGFGAGKHIAELITKGIAPSLPRELSPERFRSF